MDINSVSSDVELERVEQLERGKRIKNIRENELHMNKTQLAKEIGVSGQFLGLVEDGKGNLVYKSIKRLRNLSGHSADYILYGLDDDIIKETKQYLSKYNEEELINALQILKEITKFMKK